MKFFDDLLANWTARAAASFPAYDPAPVSKAAASVSEPVLLSGAVYGPGYAQGLAEAHAYGTLALYVGTAVIALTLAGSLLMASRKGGLGFWGKSGTLLGGVAGVLCLFGGIVATGFAEDSASRLIPQGYVVTASRIILVNGGERSDVPASSITRVARQDDGRVTFAGPTGFPVLEVTPGSRDRAALDAAVDGFTSAFHASLSVRDGTSR